MLAKVYDVERVYFHHSLLNRDEPYLPLPAVAWINQLLDGASYLRTVPIPSTKSLHLYEFKLKNGKILRAVWHVYKESPVRNSELERQLKNVETAPVAGIAGAISSKKTASSLIKNESGFPCGEQNSAGKIFLQGRRTRSIHSAGCFA